MGPGDISDLIRTPNFIQRYLQSSNILFDAQRIGGINAVSGVNVHPARRAKVVCSIRYFKIITHVLLEANLEDGEKEVTNLKLVEKELELLEKEACRLFGDSNCHGHIIDPREER